MTGPVGAGEGAHRGPDPSFIPLPGGLRDARVEAGAVFDQVADLYEDARPGYPSPAIDDLVARCGIRSTSRMLEIGCGTGQATRDLAGTGAQIHCLEPGPTLADIARHNFAGAGNVRVSTTTFEGAEEPLLTYDVIFSATAFHWIDPNVSFAKAAALLRSGGSLALMTNTHAAEGSHTDESIGGSIRELHRQLAPDAGEWTFPPTEELRRRAQGHGDIAEVWAHVERKFADPPSVAHLFDQPVVSTYPWLATYDRSGYLTMLATQSSYALMEPERRRLLLDGIGDLIDERLGGIVTKQYVTVLATAAKRDDCIGS
jgi:SAM-dependent methyltransferase